MQVILFSKKYQKQVNDIINQYHIPYTFYQKGHILLLTVENDRVTGFIDLYQLEKVTMIYAERNEHQEEILSVLLEAVERIGLNRIILNVSSSSQAFFKALGYQVISDGRMMKILEKAYHFKDYQEAVDFISKQKSRVYSLDHFKNFMQQHFSIQYVLNTVHIGGTNGKGSTVNYTKEVLKEAGYKVGTFTSPPLHDRKEVVRINDQIMDEKTVVRICNRFMTSFLDYELSIFEIEVFISILYFIYKEVDIVLYEVGLGGLLDATNIIGPLLCVNTNIGLDHIDYLGDSYESIARNKAGIIKPGVPFMTAETRQECLNVFDEVAYKNNTYVLLIDQPTHITYGETICYEYHGYHVELSTPAHYQVKNSALAICILEYLRELYPFTKEQLLNGLKKAQWAARFEKIHEHPTIIIDGAHNKEGMEAFYESAKDYENPHIIFSALKDKDTHHMIEILLKLSKDIVVTQFEHPRRATAHELVEDFNLKINEDWKNAVDEALQMSKVTFITGSLYFLSQVRDYILSKEV